MGHFAKSRLSKCTYCWSATEGQSHQELLEFLMGYSRPLFHFIFGLFQTNMTFLQQYNVKQCLSRIWCWDSNPRPLVHESSHITTRPGLPPKIELMSFLLLEQDAPFPRMEPISCLTGLDSAALLRCNYQTIYLFG